MPMTHLSYSVPASQVGIELDVKRSKFMTFAAKAANRDEAEIFIRSLRDQHPQASHVCWAYIAGHPSTTVRSMSDDGEPSGTAGMPMLKVLQHSGLGDIVVAVVRYFGGTKLGTGGLQRAYSDAVTEVLKILPTTTKVNRTDLKLVYDYEHDGAVGRLLGRFDAADIQASYDQRVSVCLAIASAELSVFKRELINITSGKVELSLVD
ncbi:YigZ family protein [Flavobacterium sp. W21_SRS_FM6]|uniref:YigZ family protein n=1 Tax=Flavobacterium sp. W21_SRS_FM6 TaxID=3240268 RepID=UPI003F92B121